MEQETTATSIIIFRRFFQKRSVTKYYTDGRIDVIVTTCIFLAAKVRHITLSLSPLQIFADGLVLRWPQVEENPRRLRDAINVIHLIRSRQKKQAEDGKEGEEKEAAADEGIPKLDKVNPPSQYLSTVHALCPQRDDRHKHMGLI